MDLQDIFIGNLKRFRRERNLTQEQLAELCDTETSYIGQIETKKRFPSLAFIEKLADAMEIRAYYLYKPYEKEDSEINKSIKDEIITTFSKSINDIFVKYGKI